MKRVLITGMSGTGKSTVCAELAKRGYRAVDTDYGGYSHEVEAPPGELTGPGEGKYWVWREDRIQDLLAGNGEGTLFVAGCAPNQGKFYSRFTHIILLSAPDSVMAERLTTRSNNPFGKQSSELARSLALKQSIEPALRRGAELEVDTSAPLDEVVEAVLRFALEGEGRSGVDARR